MCFFFLLHFRCEFNSDIDKLDANEREVGGMIGDSDTDALTWTYTSVDIGRSTNEEGLIGYWARVSEKPNVLFSHYDSGKTTSQSLSTSAVGKTIRELKEGIQSALSLDMTTIYNSWSADTWDFRTTNQLPRLKTLNY